jgi:hypothetical protein
MTPREHRKRKLISLLDRYLSQQNIKMKYVLRKYRKKLIEDQSLTDQEFSHLIPLLVWNMRMSEDQLTKYFQNLIIQKRSEEPGNTLEKFFG